MIFVCSQRNARVHKLSAYYRTDAIRCVRVDHIPNIRVSNPFVDANKPIIKDVWLVAIVKEKKLEKKKKKFGLSPPFSRSIPATGTTQLEPPRIMGNFSIVSLSMFIKRL